jgi:hypothetical protein
VSLNTHAYTNHHWSREVTQYNYHTTCSYNTELLLRTRSVVLVTNTNYATLIKTEKNRDSLVGRATRLWAGRRDDRGSIPGVGWEFFFFDTVSRPALGPTQLPIQWVPEVLFLEVKRSWREADHSPPSSAKVKE